MKSCPSLKFLGLLGTKSLKRSIVGGTPQTIFTPWTWSGVWIVISVHNPRRGRGCRSKMSIQLQPVSPFYGTGSSVPLNLGPEVLVGSGRNVVPLTR